MKYVFSVLLIFRCAMGLSQNPPEVVNGTSTNRTIDSLKLLLKGPSSNRRFYILRQLFAEYLPIDKSIASNYIDEAFEQAKMDDDSLEMVMACNGKAYMLTNNDELKEAIDLYEYALGVASRNDFSEQVKFLLNNLATCNLALGICDVALYYHFESLKLREEVGTALDISIALNNIGCAYDELNDYKNALLFYQKSYKVRLDHNLANQEIILVNIAIALDELGDYREGEKALMTAFMNCKSRQCTPDILIEIYRTFGRIRYHQERYSEAESYFDKALELLEGNREIIFFSTAESYSEGIAQTLHWYGALKFSQLQTDKSLRFLKRSQEISEQAGFRSIVKNNYLLFSKIYAERKEYELAYDYLARYVQVNSNLFNGEVRANVLTLGTKYNERENLLKIETQEKNISLQRKLNIAIGGLALLAILLVWALFRSNRRKQQTNNLLDFRVRERTSELEHGRDELKRAHDERAMVLKKISSDLGALLATLKGLFYAASHDLPPEQSKYFKEAEATTQKVADYVRLHTDRIEKK